MNRAQINMGLMLLTRIIYSNELQNKINRKDITMKLNAGIITYKLKETKQFYVEKLGFEIKFESDWFLLLSTPGDKSDIAFMLPDHPTQKSIFQPEFGGRGVFFTVEVENVDVVYEQLKSREVEIEVSIRDEEWGDRHFAIVDPNRVGIDFVTNKSF
jgi:catechol 2,3-dioxygenase-like lactoylglutathione lyase family enzyme